MWFQRRKSRSRRILVRNWWGFGDGRPIVLETSPDLPGMVNAPDPVLPRTSSGAAAEAVSSDPDDIRGVLVMAYLYHPDPEVRVAAVRLGMERCAGTIGFQEGLVDLAADADPSVHLAAVHALWSVQRATHCEHAVKALRDEIRGHASYFGVGVTTEPLRLDGESARRALDLLVEHAPDDAAREAVRALIAEHVVLPQRVPDASTKDVVFVEETFRVIDGHRATYSVYRASGKEEAITFLKAHPVHRGLYYIEVETPGATYGRDINGIYQL